ncbi:MATE family efflux transporter [Parasphaerochaeta coccoides]|uniref:MATE efflux family protein n=1 Tax=Parasphaerochaeta coccoides (strain ATCC BAA-1237 / DSM 17374 / SPN1) TaxID=760011 RepID=F4GM71_PARC1|nr:MATE family efflux transporter [Parasphaerochaeta coccoides]AEC03047.1 MATE efflux family protein [Parasphaerochaeta coccoides DSM 17374]
MDILAEPRQTLSPSWKTFLPEVFRLILPMVVQNIFLSSLSFLDVVMVGQLGEKEIAAVGLANQVFFLINLFYFGISSGSAIFVSQYWGGKNLDGLRKVMGFSLTFSGIAASVFCFVAMVMPEAVMRIFTQDAEVIAFGRMYLEIIGPGYIFAAISYVYSSTLRATGNAKTPLVFSVISLCLDATLNFVFIFGIGPFPAMGVAGAALSTTIGNGLEMSCLIIWSQLKQAPTALRRTAFIWGRKFLDAIIKTSSPVILNEVFWSLGMVMYKIAYSRMGMDVVAAVNVTEAISSLFFVIARALNIGTAVLIGIKIGEGKYELSRLYARRLIIIGIACGVLMGLVMAATAPFLPRIFNVSPALRVMTTRTLLVISLLMPLKAITGTLIVGILRSGGDTRFSMLVEMGSVWLIGVPCTFLGALVLKWDIWSVYLLVSLEEIAKAIVGLLRVRSGKWINNVTEMGVPVQETSSFIDVESPTSV